MQVQRDICHIIAIFIRKKRNSMAGFYVADKEPASYEDARKKETQALFILFHLYYTHIE
jgi:hypothetical protein